MVCVVNWAVMEAGNLDTLTKDSGPVLHLSKSFDWKKLQKLWLKLEIFLVVFIIAVVWGLLSLPVIFYHLPVDQNISKGNSNFSASGSQCLQSSTLLEESNICFEELDGILIDSCPLDTGGDVRILKNEEKTVMQLKQGLQFLGANEDCIKEVVPFLCQYLFGLCSDSGDLIQPTSTQCEALRNTICPNEWNSAVQFGIELPICNQLPPQTSCSPTMESQTSENTTTDDTSSHNVQRGITTQVFQCIRGFYRENGSSTCVPDCHTWTEYDLTLSIGIDVVLCITAIAGFIAAIVVIVISFIRRSRMLTFPSVFILYMVLDMLVLAFAVIVNYMDRPSLFCSSRNLIESIQKITPYCVIAGMIFVYTLCQTSLWWLFHTSALFWKVIFPFHSRSFELSGRVKYIHITCGIIGILLPFIPIITSMSEFAAEVHGQVNNESSPGDLFLSGGLGFTSARFPAILCVGSDRNAVFYSMVLPIDLILAVGCTLLVIIFWSVHKQNNNLKADEKAGMFRFGTAEKKLLVVFCYYTILATIALTAFTLSTRNAPDFVKNLGLYFLCEQGGHDPDNPCMKDYLQNTYPYLTSLAYVLLGLFPVVNLIYAINLKELKDFMKKLKIVKTKKKKPYCSSDTPSTGSSVAMVSTLKRKP